MTTPHHESRAWPRRAWAAFRGWRQSRPFWGGLLLVLAGIELLVSGHSSLGGISISNGPQGFLAYLLPALLLLCGLLSWSTPAQRVFYAVIAALTALYSLIGLNLGGWFLGTLLGIVGSAMTFGWGPGNSPRAAADGDAALPREPHPGEADDAPEAPAGTGNAGDRLPMREEPAPPARVENRHSGGRNGGTALAVLPPLLLATSVALAVAMAPRIAYARAASDSSPTSAPTPAQTSPVAQPADTSEPSSPPPPSAEPPASAEPTPAPDPTAPGPTGAPTAGSTTTAIPTRTTRTLQPAASTSSSLIASPVPGQGIVTLVPATMSASVLTLRGFTYDGVATVPTEGGPLATLKFTMDAASNQGFELVVGGASHALTINGDPLVAQGHVALYTTRFSGKLLGVPLTFTPDDPPPAVLPLLVFTDVSLDLVYLECDVLSVTSMYETGAG